MALSRTVAGALAGAAATVAMTGWMAIGQRTGPHGEQPPKRLVRQLARRVGVPPRRHGPGTRLATPAAHLGFGAACGALYATAVRRSTVPRGVAFGLAASAASYLGWAPAVDP